MAHVISLMRGEAGDAIKPEPWLMGCEIKVPVGLGDGSVEMADSPLLACLLFRCLASYNEWHVLSFKRPTPPKNLAGPISMLDMAS